MEKKKQMLDDFEKKIIREHQMDIRPDYRYLFEKLEKCLSYPLYLRFEELRKLINRGDEEALNLFASNCEHNSYQYAADWFDEDLMTTRSGYQWESDFEWQLRNIALGKDDFNPNKASAKI